MKIEISKKDIIWSYISQILNVGSGLITLPLILHMLSGEEIGMNYLMITISTMVGLLDFGFAPQFARNITYVFSGAQELRKEGIAEVKEEINYRLLRNMIGVAKMVYSRLAVLTLIIMLTFGSWYIYEVTNGFRNVNNSLLIWLIYTLSIYFNVYFTYYSSLLTGKGMVMEAKKSIVGQKTVYILLTFVLLILGFRLMGVVIANLISPFVGRFLAYRYFYDEETKNNLSLTEKSKEEQKELFKTIWFNAKKLGLVFVGSYAINKLSMFIAGLFLSLQDIASYGLMIQLFSIISSTALTYNLASQPQFTSYRSSGLKDALLKKFSLSMDIFYILYIFAILILIIFGQDILRIIRSNTNLPNTKILIIYAIVILLENNHSAFATLIITGNKIPFVESSLLSGFAICILSYISLKYTVFGILGLVCVQGLCQAVYSNWKWPYVVCKEYGINFMEFLIIGFNQSKKLLLQLINCH